MKKITPVLTLALCMAGLAVVDSATPAHAAKSVRIAGADAWVGARAARRNHGNTKKLKLGGADGRRKHAFVRFRVPPVGAGESLDRVVLRLRPRTTSAQGLIIHRAGNRWTERDLTWRNKPRKRFRLGASDALRAGTTEVIELDPTRVTPGRRLTLRIKTKSRRGLYLASSEVRNRAARPRLSVRTSSETTTVTPVPSANVLVGMSTDDYAARVAETGPVESRRLFVPSWNVGSLVNKLKEAHARGVTPYWSLKFNTTWQDAASGVDDARFRELGNALAQLDFPTFGSFHHEPRGGGVSTPEQLVPWSQANARAMSIIKPIAGAKHKLGTTDNGFPWSSKWGKLTDAQLRVYYTDDLLSQADFLGADFYDGKTDTNPGEPAAVKMANFQAWTTRIGFKGGLSVGEWNAVTPEDIHAAGDVLLNGRWAIACLFNSADNNRADLPTDGSLGDPPSWVLQGDRLTAFRELLARDKASSSVTP